MGIMARCQQAGFGLPLILRFDCHRQLRQNNFLCSSARWSSHVPSGMLDWRASAKAIAQPQHKMFHPVQKVLEAA